MIFKGYTILTDHQIAEYNANDKKLPICCDLESFITTYGEDAEPNPILFEDDDLNDYFDNLNDN